MNYFGLFSKTNNISRFIDFPHSYGVDKLPFSRELGRKKIIAYLLQTGRVSKFGFASVHRKKAICLRLAVILLKNKFNGFL